MLVIFTGLELVNSRLEKQKKSKEYLIQVFRLYSSHGARRWYQILRYYTIQIAICLGKLLYVLNYLGISKKNFDFYPFVGDSFADDAFTCDWYQGRIFKKRFSLGLFFFHTNWCYA